MSNDEHERTDDGFGCLTNLIFDLANRYPNAIDPELARTISAMMERKFDADAAYTLGLMRKRAGLEQHEDGSAPEQRLSSPRFTTTPRNERHRILGKNMLESADDLIAHLGPALTAALRLKLFEAELLQENRRDADVKDSLQARKATGLYQAVTRVSDILYEQYKVNHTHWACLSDAQIREFARILKPPS